MPLNTVVVTISADDLKHLELVPGKYKTDFFIKIVKNAGSCYYTDLFTCLRYLSLSVYSEDILFPLEPILVPHTPGSQYVICWMDGGVVTGTLFGSVNICMWARHGIFSELVQQGHLEA